MTEKRFKSAFYDTYDGTFSIQDKLYSKENKHLHTLDEIIDLLNELDKKYIDEFSLRETLQQELQRSEEENKQLKTKLIKTRKKLNNTPNTIHEKKTKNNKNKT